MYISLETAEAIKHPDLAATQSAVLQLAKGLPYQDCWKDSYNPVVVAGHVDRPEGLLFQPAPLRGFGPDCRTVTLVNTSTVTIIPASALSF
jgi:hypothetical protein